MSDSLDAILKKIDMVEKELPKKVLPKVRPYMNESLNRAMTDFYNGYSPTYYKRTNNLMGLANNRQINVSGNSIIMTVSSDSMSDYPGAFKTPLSASTAFNFMYENGEHGHGMWHMATSEPPDMLVEQDLMDGYGGRVDIAISQALNEIFN